MHEYMSTWFINLNNFNIQEAVYVCVTQHSIYMPLSDNPETFF